MLEFADDTDDGLAVADAVLNRVGGRPQTCPVHPTIDTCGLARNRRRLQRVGLTGRISRLQLVELIQTIYAIAGWGLFTRLLVFLVIVGYDASAWSTWSSIA